MRFDPVREQLMRQIRTLGYIRRAHFPDEWSDIADYTDKHYEVTLARRRLPARGKANGGGVLGVAQLRREPRS